ncbi:VOC family protein [[Clostridium] fimetarium]|uniref:VOC domain-containing protein n=1 Tax=[Clostridium] fimetarium TaxID=99656 RepID=A0A1I0QUM1_9FIRM|nr:VOC family protein [[Clostridium] fimetarium]SEW31322.1 hypothetical protein SAMN05421659_109138 [[Clostridium] fimetarium]
MFHINSLYICVNDMDRAIAFYEDFFERKVSEKDRIYSVFEIDGFRFGLFAYLEMNEKHLFGSNCLPSVSVNNKFSLETKLSKLNVVFLLSKIGENWVAEFEDNEGNHIEITAPVEC